MVTFILVCKLSFETNYPSAECRWIIELVSALNIETSHIDRRDVLCPEEF